MPWKPSGVRRPRRFLRELTRTLGNCSKLDSEKLSKYVFQGKTLGELIDHLDSKGLRFSHPSEQDANLYASIFFIMRYAYQESEKSRGATSGDTNNTPAEPPGNLERQGADKGIAATADRKWLDLLSRVDVVRDRVQGEWKQDGTGLSCMIRTSKMNSFLSFLWC